MIILFTYSDKTAKTILSNKLWIEYCSVDQEESKIINQIITNSLWINSIDTTRFIKFSIQQWRVSWDGLTRNLINKLKQYV